MFKNFWWVGIFKICVHFLRFCCRSKLSHALSFLNLQILTVKSGEEDYRDTSYVLRQASPFMEIKYNSTPPTQKLHIIFELFLAVWSVNSFVLCISGIIMLKNHQISHTPKGISKLCLELSSAKKWKLLIPKLAWYVFLG